MAAKGKGRGRGRRRPSRSVRPRAFEEWRVMRRWGELPTWERGIAGYVLRLARARAGLTQAELADRLGVSQQAVSRAEQWAANPTVGLMSRWLAACGFELELSLRPGKVETAAESS